MKRLSPRGGKLKGGSVKKKGEGGSLLLASDFHWYTCCFEEYSLSSCILEVDGCSMSFIR